MDGNVKDLKIHKYLKLCQKQWQWILDNYDQLVKKGYKYIWDLKSVYFKEYNLDVPILRCYLCELTDQTCLECPLSGIAWRETHDYPCANDEYSVYRRITDFVTDNRHKEAKDAIKEFLSIIDKECRRKGVPGQNLLELQQDHKQVQSYFPG